MKKIKELFADVKESNKNNFTTTAVFCVLIAGLTVASMVNPVKTYSASEKRELAQKPEFTFDALFNGSYTADYEEFITDQFVFRDSWITIKNYAERTLGKTDSADKKDDKGNTIKGIYFAKDGYLIEKHTLNNEQLDKNLGFLKNFLNRYSDNYNVRVLIAPTASLALSDKLPLFAPIWDQDAMLDRVAELGNFVDCRDVLKEHSDEYIYYRTDHHWTTLGAYYAYTELCASLGIEPYDYEYFDKRVLSDKFLGTLSSKVNMKTSYDELYTLDSNTTLSVSYPLSNRVTDTLYEEKYLTGSDKYSTFLDGNQPMVEITTSVKNGKTLLLIKDSYSHCMVPMLTAHYEKIVLLDMRSYTRGIYPYLTSLEAENQKVDDIVILYNAENFSEDRNIYGLMK